MPNVRALHAILPIACILCDACTAPTSYRDEVLGDANDLQGNIGSSTWPENVRLTAWVPIIDTVCEKWVQVYVTLEAIDCEAAASGPKLDSWILGVRPLGSNDLESRLVLDPLKLDSNNACRLHYVSRPWQSPHAFALADAYQLSILGPLGMKSLRFSSYQPSSELNVTYSGDAHDVEIMVQGLKAVPTSGAFVDHIVTKSLHGKLQVRDGLMLKWFDLSFVSKDPVYIDHFDSLDIEAAEPLGVQLRVEYTINSFGAPTTAPDESEPNSPPISIHVVRYVDRPFDASGVDCTL